MSSAAAAKKHVRSMLAGCQVVRGTVPGILRVTNYAGEAAFEVKREYTYGPFTKYQILDGLVECCECGKTIDASSESTRVIQVRSSFAYVCCRKIQDS